MAEVVQREADPRQNAMCLKVPLGCSEVGVSLVEPPFVLGTPAEHKQRVALTDDLTGPSGLGESLRGQCSRPLIVALQPGKPCPSLRGSRRAPASVTNRRARGRVRPNSVLHSGSRGESKTIAFFDQA